MGQKLPSGNSKPHSGHFSVPFALHELIIKILSSCNGAGNEIRTRDKSLEGSHVTTTPMPQVAEDVGVEPTLRYSRSTD